MNALPLHSPGPFSAVTQVHTRCVVVSFLANLSWHDDNKIQMYQAAEEVTRSSKTGQ